LCRSARRSSDGRETTAADFHGIFKLNASRRVRHAVGTDLRKFHKGHDILLFDVAAGREGALRTGEQAMK
jgi:hypothetical protein